MTERPKLSYVDWQKGRDGVTWYPYFRDNGSRTPLPRYGTPEFHTEYGRRLEEKRSRAKPSSPAGYLPGTWGALTTEFFASPEFRDRKPNTQSMYRRFLEPLAEKYGHKRVATLERHNIRGWRDALAETPGMANMLVKIVKLILSFAVENDYRPNNPALRLKLFKLGEHRAWTNDECAAFEAHWPEGTMERRAYMLAKYTTQRCGDLAAMTQGHRRDGGISIIQEKTGTRVSIPEFHELTAELARGVQHMSLLVRRNGASHDADSLSRWFASAIEKAGLPDDCVLHGLRKTGAVMYVEAGSSAPEGMAITGHKAPSVFNDYIKDADRKKLAGSAVRKLRNAQRTKSAKRPLSGTAKHAKGA